VQKEKQREREREREREELIMITAERSGSAEDRETLLFVFLRGAKEVKG